MTLSSPSQGPEIGPGFFRTVLRGGVVFAVAAGFGAIAIVGVSLLHARADASPDAEIRSPLPVSVVEARQRESYALVDYFSGRVEAREHADLAFELSGLVTDVLVEEGDRVTTGTVIARMDTALLEDERRRLIADRSALRADLVFAEKTEERQKSLEGKGFASTAALDQAESTVRSLNARIISTNAAIASVQTRLEKSVVTAPFDGAITLRHIDPGSVMAAGAPVVTLMDTVEPELRIGVAPDTAETLVPGQRLEAVIDGKSFLASIRTVLPNVDPVTRSRDVLFDIVGPDKPVIGQTVTVALDRTLPKQGMWLPRAALTEGERGLWTVLVVAERDGQPVAAREAVRIVHAQSDQVFVEGTIANGMPVIVSGTHRLAPGQPVRPQPVD